MSSIKPSLLAKLRFGPIFATQFGGAFNDNLYRSAMLFSLSFGVAGGATASAHGAALYAALAGAVFILPYFLFSGIAGQVADRTDKAKLARIVKLAEIGIMAIGGWGLVSQSLPVLFVALFAMGAHSTFFGPIKYSILPQHLKDDELLAGTGMVEAGTFVAILPGQIAGGVLHHQAAAIGVLVVAALGTLASYAIPSAPPMAAERPPIDPNPITSTMAILRHARANPPLFRSALGITWFFALGGVLTQEMPPLTLQIGASPSVAVMLLALFSVGVAAGSVLVSRLQKGVVSARYVPISAFAVALGVLDLSFSTAAHVVSGAGLTGFLSDLAAWRIMLDVTLVAVAGGVYVVPLYALLQTLGDPAQRSREIAANNVVNAIGMVGVAGAAAMVAGMGASISTTFLILGLFGIGVAAYSCVLLPDASVKHVLKLFLRIAYRVDVKGAENMPQPGERAVVVVNHTSFLDAAVLAAFLPGKPTFAVATKIAEAWWMRPLMKLFDAFPVDPTNPMSAKAMVRAVKEGRTLVIFPEGRITMTGALMKIFDGPGMVADKADAPIVPVRIDGAQYTPFSRLKGKVRRRTFPDVSLTILPPVSFVLPDGLTARQRRAESGRRLYDVMSSMMFQTSLKDQTLFDALLDAREVHGAKTPIVEDVMREPMSIGRLVVGSIALGRAVRDITADREAVGLLLPNVNATVVSFFALQSVGRVPAMLNYTSGLASLRSACRTGGIRLVLTSGAFLKQAKLEEMADSLSTPEWKVEVLTLESVRTRITASDRLSALLSAPFARRSHAKLGLRPDDAACILFTSGSEGVPKGVVLSHRNLLANCRQLAARVDFNPTDVVLNALPVFHSFGLTGGMLLPILNGLKTVLYPNPLRYRIVPALAYDSNATIMFGTDTFLSGYARMASPYDFYSLRYVFAGAERVREETRRTWAEKFGVRIFEGYGATEAAPVIAVNTPMHYAGGTVGRALPGIETRLDPVPGIEEGGRLSIRGPNVMLGYYRDENPGVLQPPAGGWHDTGDIVEIDGNGFITIKGRAKRFAKIAGEMVSLPAVEGYAGKAFPGFDHAVVARPDPKKGEQLVLFTTSRDATTKAFQLWARGNGVTELSVPKEIVALEVIPVLGTGKTDYVTLDAKARESKEPVLDATETEEEPVASTTS
jgi:acyl-[acyl-carrier-protein]-phospholipid O-acyltransferase/long-chain-fatty-acid--[acyl-carrier-protein] ligase